MNKQLGPGVLIVLGIILLYFGGTVSGVLGSGMAVGGLVCVFAAIVSGIKKLAEKGKPDKLDLDMKNPDSVENTGQDSITLL